MYEARVLKMDVYNYDPGTGEVGDFIMTKEGYHVASAETIKQLRDYVDAYFGHEVEIDDYNPEYLCTSVIENEECEADINGKFLVDYTVIANHKRYINFRTASL